VLALGWRPVVLGSQIEGEAAGLGGFLGTLAAESSARGRPFTPGTVLLAAGGEATVTVRRQAAAAVGHGGPNQEMALAFARAAARSAATVAGAFVDSDGSDGGTDAAGGCVDSTTAPHAEQHDRTNLVQVEVPSPGPQQPAIELDQAVEGQPRIGGAQSGGHHVEHDPPQLRQTVVEQLRGIADDRVTWLLRCRVQLPGSRLAASHARPLRLAGESGGPGRSPRRRVPLRSAAAGCTLTCVRPAPALRS
jgi:hypothetical protein